MASLLSNIKYFTSGLLYVSFVLVFVTEASMIVACGAESLGSRLVWLQHSTCIRLEIISNSHSKHGRLQECLRLLSMGFSLYVLKSCLQNNVFEILIRWFTQTPWDILTLLLTNKRTIAMTNWKNTVGNDYSVAVIHKDEVDGCWLISNMRGDFDQLIHDT